MEIEQLAKRVEWLDEERRKDKTMIATLQEQISLMQGGIDALQKEIKLYQNELNQFNSIYGKLEQLDSSMAQIRVETGRSIESMTKTCKENEYEQEEKRRREIVEINKSIFELNKPLEILPELKKSITQLQGDYKNVIETLPGIDQKVMESRVGFEEFQRSQQVIEESRKLDTKRMTDLQGEVSAYRKRIDEQRARIDVLIENVKKLETRVNELNQSEADRRQSQIAFFEKQSQQQVDLDRQWREMQAKFGAVEQAAASIEGHQQLLDETLRGIRKTKDQLDESTQRIDRRVNEITEMHRLNEDHFRQEWAAYKADDQKRWANYNLVQEEQQKDYQRQLDRLEQRLVQVEDITQQASDHFDELNEETRKRLRSLLDIAHTWVSNYERTFGKPTENE